MAEEPIKVRIVDDSHLCYPPRYHIEPFRTCPMTYEFFSYSSKEEAVQAAREAGCEIVEGDKSEGEDGHSPAET